MTTLMIKDLSRTEELDSKAMAAVRGGKYYVPSFSLSLDKSKHDFSVDVKQLIQQSQEVNTGNNVAFLDHSTIKADVDQTAKNTSNIRF